LKTNEKELVLKESCKIVKSWHEEFHHLYPKLDSAFSFLKTMKIDFENGISTAFIGWFSKTFCNDKKIT
jgi:hypothetical protein